MNVSQRSRRQAGDSIRQTACPCGFTLLEVILAIALLAITLAAIGEVVRLALRNANDAADQPAARLVAQSVLAELKSGARQLIDFGPAPLDSESAWDKWSVQVIIEPTVTDQLLQVRVLVDREIVASARPACELVRWFPNPQYAVVPTTTGLQ